ncbi:hypothetical protein ANT2_2568 [plant metagenome]|uniref:DUF4878 domain-containing protein n=1 Tax=plant metagenome TaxID=1297885 RepID=A0A484RJU3_9ZZZZ
MQVSRIWSFFMLAAFSALLSACSGGSPESVVETFYKAAAKGDTDTAVKQISFAKMDAGQTNQAKGKVQMMVGEMQRRADANGGLDKVEVLESKIEENGESARVRVKLVFKNGKTSDESGRLLKDDGDWKMALK